MAAVQTSNVVRVAALADVVAKGRIVVSAGGRPIALFYTDDTVKAVDNRCPHMGFPLHRGSVDDGVLTCHWHHARFDLCSGGTFDQFADDLRAYPVEVRDGDVYLDLSVRRDPREYALFRLRDGLELNIGLVIAKAVVSLTDGGDPARPFEAGLIHGSTYNSNGWGQGLTMHTALMNILPALRPDDRPRALYHGLTAVARDCAGQAPRFPIAPLPGGGENDLAALKRWFRQFIEVRNSDGAERCIASAVRSGASGPEVADMLFAAASDHRYVSIGHPLDFTNKAFEALDTAGWEHAELVLTSLVGGLAGAARMEESDSWRRPVDLVALLERAFVALPDALAEGAAKVHDADFTRAALAAALLDDDPAACIEALLSALRLGATPEQAASATAYAAALRIAQFSTSNEFGDWDTVLHTFTFANAVHQGMKRAPSIELLRGVFDAAMSVYLDRFLNTPPAALPRERKVADPEALLVDLEAVFDRRQQVDQSAELTAAYLASGGDPAKLLAALGSSLLREDRDFHTIQAFEAAFRQFENLGAASEGARVLVAATRYLAAHAATPRAQLQTYNIAVRLHHGDNLYEAE